MSQWRGAGSDGYGLSSSGQRRTSGCEQSDQSVGSHGRRRRSSCNSGSAPQPQDYGQPAPGSRRIPSGEVVLLDVPSSACSTSQRRGQSLSGSLGVSYQGKDEATAGMLLVIDGSHVRQMAHRQPNGPEIDYERLVSYLEELYGLPVREAYFADTFVESGFEEASLQRAHISVVLGRMKKATYRRVAPPHDMVLVHCQGGVDSRITALLLSRGLGLMNELPERAIGYKVSRVILMSSDTDFEHAVSELVGHGKPLTLLGFTTPGNHILCSLATDYVDITRSWGRVRREVTLQQGAFATAAGAAGSALPSSRRPSPISMLGPPLGTTITTSTSSSSTPAPPPPPPKPLAPGLLPLQQQLELVELHLEADDLNRLARLAFVEAQRPETDPQVRAAFPSPWREHLIPGALQRFSQHMHREHGVREEEVVGKCWRHMLRFLPVWGCRNALPSREWQEVLLRAAEHGKRGAEASGTGQAEGGPHTQGQTQGVGVEGVCVTFRRMDLVLLKRFPCLSSLFVYYARSSYAAPLLGSHSDGDLQRLWAFVRSFCSAAQLDVLRRQEWALHRLLFFNLTGGDTASPSFEDFVQSGRADSAFASAPGTLPSSPSSSSSAPPKPLLSPDSELLQLGVSNVEAADYDYDDTDSDETRSPDAHPHPSSLSGPLGARDGKGKGDGSGGRVDSMFGFDVLAPLGAKPQVLQWLVGLLSSGLRGEALYDAILRPPPDSEPLSGALLLLAVFKSLASGLGRQNHDAIAAALGDVTWLAWHNYGTALRASLAEDVTQQVAALLVTIAMCAFLRFPKCTAAQGGGYLIDRLFTLLLQHKFIHKDVFHAWWSDNGQLDDDRMTTISQTVSFFAALYEAEPDSEPNSPVLTPPPQAQAKPSTLPHVQHASGGGLCRGIGEGGQSSGSGSSSSVSQLERVGSRLSLGLGHGDRQGSRRTLVSEGEEEWALGHCDVHCDVTTPQGMMGEGDGDGALTLDSPVLGGRGGEGEVSRANNGGGGGARSLERLVGQGGEGEGQGQGRLRQARSVLRLMEDRATLKKFLSM